MTSQLLIGAKRWEPSGSSFRALREQRLRDNNTYPRYHITYTKKEGLDPLALIIDFIRTPPTFIRTCADECGNPIP